MYRGLFVVLEGPDNTGKTTQHELVADRLTALGYEVVRTREVGGTPLAERIRSMFLNDPDMLPEVQVAMISAARLDHIQRVIKPNLEAGKIVLCDRWHHSTFAYNVWPHVKSSINHSLVDFYTAVNGIVCNGLVEDLCLVLTGSREAIEHRRSLEAPRDAYEERGSEFFDSVHEAYTHLAKSGHAIGVDAFRSVTAITDEIVELITAARAKKLQLLHELPKHDGKAEAAPIEKEKYIALIENAIQHHLENVISDLRPLDLPACELEKIHKSLSDFGLQQLRLNVAEIETTAGTYNYAMVNQFTGWFENTVNNMAVGYASFIKIGGGFK